MIICFFFVILWHSGGEYIICVGSQPLVPPVVKVDQLFNTGGGS